jgi:plastocyanin
MFTKRVTWFLSILTAFSLLQFSEVGCGKKPSEQGAPSAEAPSAEGGAEAPAAPSGEIGSIKGKVNFTGTAPEMPELNRQADPFCAKTPMKAQEVVINANNTLKNVAVTITRGAPAIKAPVEAATAEIDQQNCMYAPRTITSVFGQVVKIVNSDPILHNVHTYAGDKTLFNRAQPKGAPAIDKSFTKEDGEVIKFKCDVHPWMTGWLVQSDSGLSAVTGDNGEFEIKNVPVGSYTLQAWQEQYGTKSIEVTVQANQAAEADFSFDGTEKAAYRYKEVHIGFMNHTH